MPESDYNGLRKLRIGQQRIGQRLVGVMNAHCSVEKDKNPRQVWVFRTLEEKYLPEPVLAPSPRGRVTVDNDYMLYAMDAQAIRADVDRANERLQTAESLKEQLLTWLVP